MNPLEYTYARMQELKPRIQELGSAERALTDEERDEFTRITGEWDELDERKIDLEERGRRAAAAGKVDFSFNKAPDPFKADLRHMNRTDAIGAGRSAIEMAQKRFARPEHAEAASKLIDRMDGVGELAARMAVSTLSDEYRQAWLNYMTGHSTDRDDVLLEAAKAEYQRAGMTAGTGSSGGYFVPLMLDPTMVITGAGSYNPFRRVANVKQINTLIYNGATAAQVTAAFVGENSAVQDNTPVVSQVQITTYKGEAYIPASFEAFEDIDALAQDVLALFSDAKDNLEATQFATGSGSAPHGVVADVGAVTASRVSPATGGAYAVADLYSVHGALPPRYRYNGQSLAWVSSVQTIDKTRQFATANNYHAFLVPLAPGAPEQMLGSPVIESSAMSSSYTTGQDILLYGDFSKFYIVDRIGMTTEFIPNIFDTSTGRPTGTRAWLMHWRTGSGTADTGAFRLLRL